MIPNIPAELRKWVALGVTIAVLCLAFAVLTMCRAKDEAKVAQANETLAEGRTDSAVVAIDVIAENTEAAAETHAEVKEAQDEIRSMPAGPDRERVARCRLRELQGHSPC